MSCSPDLFKDIGDGDEISVFYLDGHQLVGKHLTVVGMHFLHVKGPGHSLNGEVLGPLTTDTVSFVARLKTSDEIKANLRERLRGTPHPGRAPQSRDDYRYRLEVLARAIATEQCLMRKDQLRYQFDEVADAICLAAPKRAWMQAEAKWSLRSNRPPELSDLWFCDLASPSKFARPRDQDFDPDPLIRRKRLRPPLEIQDDPLSIPNVLARLRAEGFAARISLAGDPAWSRAEIQIDLAAGRSARFLLRGDRHPSSGETAWSRRWGGNDSKNGTRLLRRATALPEYARLREILRSIGCSK